MNRFFISPSGAIVQADAGTHITTIISNPALFGLDESFIQLAYSKYDEKMGREGQAREEILITLFKMGWCRGNYFPQNDKYIINCWELNGRTKQNLRKMASEASKGNIVNSKTIYSDVMIQVFNTNEVKSTNITGLLSGYMAFKNVMLNKHSTLL